MSEGLSDHQARALASVLDEIIPPSDDGSFPGAGELGLASYIEQVLQQAPEFRPVILQGLSTLDELARGRSAQSFAELSSQEKVEVLNELTSTDQVFLPSLTLHTYIGYYQHGRVLEALGLEPRPPYPEGYEMKPSDLRLLDPVRRRPKLYREC